MGGTKNTWKKKGQKKKKKKRLLHELPHFLFFFLEEEVLFQSLVEIPFSSQAGTIRRQSAFLILVLSLFFFFFLSHIHAALSQCLLCVECKS